jgi:predicted RNase H-like nuclease (RuvC/YqgF family)
VCLLKVTKKHARLSKRELAALEQTPATENPGPDQTARTDQSETPKEKTWQKAPYVVDSYANRHLAQQKILEQQQKQIKEQQRLIEELTYLQKQQMLQQQALQSQTQQLASIQNGGMTGGVVTGGGDASKLQQHIDNLQKELVAKNQDLDELQKEIERNEQETSRCSGRLSVTPMVGLPM